MTEATSNHGKYVDLQVNGYGGVDFNKEGLTADELHQACVMMREHGVDTMLATIVTEAIGQMASRLATLADLRERDPLVKSVIGGFHIEGPFINETKGYRGAHPEDAIHPTNADEMNQLLDAAKGLTRLVTLAPERDPGMKVTRMLADRGIVISAGHCDASVDELKAAIDAGLTLFTHLGNGCPAQVNRHDNIVQRALSLSDQLRICFIADGAHVPFFALRNYLQLADVSRCIIVTDAVSPAGLGPGTYTMSRWTVKVGPDMVVRAPDGSHLVGAAITMPQTEKNLREHLGLSAEVCRRLMCDNPRAAVGLTAA